MARYSDAEFLEERNQAIWKRFNVLVSKEKRNASQAYDKMKYEFWETQGTLKQIVCKMRKRQQLTLFN